MEKYKMEKKERLMSLDALRGFDMFFITGGAAIVSGLCLGFGLDDSCWLVRQMRHVPWAGLAHHDTIFPLFLFLAGVSWPFSLASQEARGRTPWQIHRKVLVRALVLFLLGLSSGGILAFKPTFRIPSVLGQIGLAWGAAALIAMHVKRNMVCGAIVASILVGYWAVLNFFAAPGSPIGADTYAMEFNVVSWLDRTLMPNHILERLYDPESVFSVPAATALALVGVMSGDLLRSQSLTGARKAAVLFGAALVALAATLFFVYVLKMPVVKRLWTSSFVLATAAYSLAMLAAFYWIIDVKGWRKWTFPLRVVGMNSIAIYMLGMTGVISALQKYCFAGLCEWSGVWSTLMWGSTTFLAGWLILYFLYRKNIFVKV